MDQVLTSQSILLNYQFLSAPNDVASLNQAKLWRKNVISNQDNIISLINFFQDTPLQPECQIFILSMIHDIIDAHLNSLQLSRIAILLSQTKTDILSNQSVILLLGNLIGYITRFIYQEEHFFLFNISKDQVVCPKLQWTIYHNIIEYMDQPRADCTEKQKNELITAFKHDILISFFYLSINAMDNISQTEDAIHLLSRCLQFDNKKAKLRIAPLDETTAKMLDTLQNRSLFEKFTIIVQNSHSPLSSDTVDLMKFILNNMVLSSIHLYLELIDLIIQFTSEILKMPNFFKDRNNINSFKNFFSSFPKTTEIITKCESLASDLLSFLIFNLRNNYFLAIDILFSVSQFFENFLMYISKDSPLFECFSNFLDIFVESTLNALEISPVDVYNSILLDSAMRSEMKKLIEKLFILSNPKKDECVVNVCYVLANLTGRPFNHIINFQIGFLLFFMRVVFTLSCVNCFEPPGCLIFESAFNFFLFTNDKIGMYGQILGEKFPFVFEYYSLFFLKSFCTLFFASDELEKTIPRMAELFETPSSVVVFVFQRFWNDLINNVCTEKSSKCLRVFVDLSRNSENPSPVLKIISMTNYPNDFLNAYLVLPSKSIIYYTVINVMLTSDEVSPKFLSSLEENFTGKSENETIKKLFKILSSWFDCGKDPKYWLSTYLYFSSHFIDTCLHASSQSIICISLLKLLYQITSNIPVSNPFDANEPHSFQMIQNLMLLLTNITNEATVFLLPIQIDDAIYDKVFVSDIFDSKPITLSEAHIIGLNDRQMKMKKSYSSKAENINEDEAWSIIYVVIIIANNTINSSIANFAIMEYYNDTCIFVFFDKLVTAISKTSNLSFVSQEHKFKEMIEELSELIQLIVKHFKNIVISSDKFSHFILDFIRVTFLSHNREVVKQNCATLCFLIRGFNKPSEVEILRTHFILAFNAALYFIDCFSAHEFVFEFSRIDPEFFAHIGSLIEADLKQEVRRKVFHDNFEKLWRNMEMVNEESKEMLRQKLSLCFTHFLDSIAPHSIKLYSLPSLAQYFDFH